jgi:hypothetical protein
MLGRKLNSSTEKIERELLSVRSYRNKGMKCVVFDITNYFLSVCTVIS